MRAKWVKNKPKTTSVSPLDELETVSSQRVCRLLAAVGRWLFRLVDRLPGQCTVSKLDAFDVFQRETSRGKVAVILFLTPVPCLVVNLLLECIPLNDPTTGFLSSGHYKLRMFLTGFLSSLMPLLIKVDCVPQSPAEQFWVSFLLPFLKLTVQRVLWLLTKDDHDLIAVMTSCVGHLYYFLFIAMVLQHPKSLKTVVILSRMPRIFDLLKRKLKEIWGTDFDKR